ncbi:tRNA (cytosine(34)-C(5))-methyltransferase, mitochondrial [Aplochiton taeniatus]
MYRKVNSRHAGKKSPCQPVLDNFDCQYSDELGPLWPSTRAVLLDPQCWQYGVMLNRFTSLKDLKLTLHSQGFISLLTQSKSPMKPFSRPTPMLASNYLSNPSNAAPPTHSITDGHPDPPEINPHRNRLSCHDPPSIALLHATPPSFPDHHSQPGPFDSPQTAPFFLPHPSLQCYIHSSVVRFPSQAHRSGHLKQYYLLNAASLLPVLALGVQDGDRVLDLCSAPGGKALAILQTANPALLCCNELDPQRRDWLAKTLESFLPQSLSNTVIISNQDGQDFGQREAGMYDKVLVDAPCSNDRSWLYSSSDQQGEMRLRERAKLPRLQVQLLKSALATVRPGGVVVYSTCTLSRSENHGVVEQVLNTFPGAELEHLEEELVLPFSEHFTFSPAHGTFSHTHSDEPQPRQTLSHHSLHGNVSCHRDHGVLVVPAPGRAWGPMFLSRLRRKG